MGRTPKKARNMKESSTILTKRYIVVRYARAASTEKAFRSTSTKELPTKGNSNTVRKMGCLGCRKRGRTMKDN